MLISIIIITLNEVNNLNNTIQGIKKATKSIREFSVSNEIIVSDGGSNDGTIELAKAIADEVIHSPKGKFKQLNAGAKVANGDVLVFLHADTVLPKDSLAQIFCRLSNKCVLGGGFKKVWVSGQDGRLSKLIQIIISIWNLYDNWMVRLTKNFPGDNVIFVRKAIYDKLSGFAPLWICEDIDFSYRLKKFCKKNPCIINKNSKSKHKIIFIKSAVKTSTRRFEEFGFFKTLRSWALAYINWRFAICHK